MRVIIIGAGIGGVCTAIALRQAGIEATLYEKSDSLRVTGAGISLWPNATRTLKQFGLLDELLAQGEQILQTQIQSAQGQSLTGLDLTRFDAPSFCIKRSRLQTTLVNHLSDTSIHLGHELTGVTQDETGVTVQFSNGNEAKADLLVAADGIYSTTRSLLWNAPEPKYQGYMAWRGILKQSLSGWPQGEALQCWGRGKRFGLLAMNSNEMYWFAAINSRSSKVECDDKKKFLSQTFQGWTSKVRDAIALTQEEDIVVRPIETAPRLRKWHQHRVLLLGDSAHAMTPNLGQGACMAIEDAAILAKCLVIENSPEDALAAYEKKRKWRVNQVILRSYLLGQVGQLESLTLTQLRSQGLRLAPKALLQISFKTLFNSRAMM